MKINNINNFTPSLKSNDKNFGYDDSISHERRSYLREHILENTMPYYEILENSKRLEKYELKKLISSLCGQKFNQDSLQNIFKQIQHSTTSSPKTNSTLNFADNVNSDLIENLPLYNLELISKKMDAYRGESLVGNSYALEILKRAGIERIIDLIGYEYLKDDCARLGLEYHCFPMNPLSLNQKAMFKTKEENKQTFFSHCRRFGYQGKNAKDYIQKRLSSWEENKNKELDEFVKFIQTMQKGKLYIGCEYGTHTTDNTLMLNAFFNPAYINTKKYITSFNYIYVKKLEKLYQNLTPEHKKLMGWTREFDKQVAHKVKQNYKFY